MSDLHRLGALAQAALIARREVSVEELTRHHLDRITRLDPELGAFVQVRPELALSTARRLDQTFHDVARGPLWGLPTGLKDLHFTRGFYARMGSRAFRWLWSPFDDVTSRAVRQAGMVIVGKLATSELAIMPVVEPDLQPPTRNPWDRSRSAGGSSGGSAAAVAAQLLPLAPASDGAGSIRIPASFCGLIGLKPSRGLVPNPFRRVEPLELSVVGPHARDVDDAAALLDVLAGRDPRQPTSFLALARIPPPPLRIAFTTDAPLGRTDPRTAVAVERVAMALSDLGHQLEPARPLVGTVEEYLPMFDFLARNAFIPWEPALQPVTRWLRARGRDVTLAQARACRATFARRAEAWLAGYDLAITPTVPGPPPAVGAWRDLEPAAVMHAAAPLGQFTAAFNAGGQPALSLPIARDSATIPTDDHLPIGVQLVGHAGDDARLLALARTVCTVTETRP